MRGDQFCHNKKCPNHRPFIGNTLTILNPETGGTKELARMPYRGGTLKGYTYFCEVCNEAIKMTYKEPT